MCPPIFAAALTAPAGIGAGTMGFSTLFGTAAAAPAAAGIGMSALQTASLGLSALSTGMSAVGSYQQGQAAQAQANYQAAVSRNNQILAERAAQDALTRGEANVAAQARRTRQLISRQRVAQAGMGQLVDVGSALDLTVDTAGLGKLDELTLRNMAEREAFAARVEAGSHGAQAGLLQAQGASAARAGTTGAFGSLLTGAGSVADKWYQFRREDPNFRLFGAL